MDDKLKTAATAIATRASAVVGFPIATIISIVSIALPLISKLMEGCGGGEATKRVASNHWDETSDEPDSRAIKRLRPELRQATRIHNRRTGDHERPTKAELDAMAVEAIRQAKDQPKEEVVACMASAGQLYAAAPGSFEIDD